MADKIRHYFDIFFEYVNIQRRVMKKMKTLLILNTLQVLIFQFVNIIMILAVFQTQKTLKGWSQFDLLFMFSFSELITDIFYMLTGGIFKLPKTYVNEGGWDKVSAYPFNSLSLLFFENMTFTRIAPASVSIIVMAAALFFMGVKLTIAKILLMVLTIVSGFLILTGMSLAIGSFVFYMKTRQSPAGFLIMMLNFSKYPVTYFDKIIQIILTYIVPFSFVSFYPLDYILGKTDNYFPMIVSFLMGIIFMIIGIVLFEINEKHYKSVGSN